jgi:hypothetical protein
MYVLGVYIFPLFPRYFRWILELIRQYGTLYLVFISFDFLDYYLQNTFLNRMYRNLEAKGHRGYL